MTIQKSLYKLVFLLIVVPFLVFTLLITHIYTGRLERVITDSLRVVSDARIAELANFCEQQKNYLLLLGMMDVSQTAAEGNLDEEGRAYLDDMLSSYVEMSDYMKSLAIIDKNSRVVASSSSNPDVYAQSGIHDIISGMQGRSFYISNVRENRWGEKVLVEVARLEKDGKLMGYALGEVTLEAYTQMREETTLWTESTQYLLDGKKQIISAGTAEEARENFVSEDAERRDYNEKYNTIDFEENPQGSFSYSYQGTDYVTYYSDVTYTDWQMLLTVNMDNYKAERSVYIVLAAFLVSLCLVLSVWLGWFVSQRILRPLQRISGTLQAIQEKQDYSLRVEPGEKDELGNLSREINELINFIETENLYKLQQQRLLQKKAEQDALTKVFNKERMNVHLEEILKQHQRAGSDLAVLFFDVDNFKDFNSDYGHNVGDQVLLFIAALLEKTVGGTIGRVGGDEFLAVVEDLQVIQNLDGYLERIQLAARTEFVIRGSNRQIPVTCSIGAVWIDCAALKNQKLTAEQVVYLADTAMYQAKNAGKGRHVILKQ